MAMETANSWPKVANPEFFEHKNKGAPGFVQRFYKARAAFIAHRVCDKCKILFIYTNKCTLNRCIHLSGTSG